MTGTPPASRHKTTGSLRIVFASGTPVSRSPAQQAAYQAFRTNAAVKAILLMHNHAAIDYDSLARHKIGGGRGKIDKSAQQVVRRLFAFYDRLVRLRLT